MRELVCEILKQFWTSQRGIRIQLVVTKCIEQIPNSKNNTDLANCRVISKKSLATRNCVTAELPSN